MNYSLLYQHDIFPVSLKDKFSDTDIQATMLYSPLSKAMVVVNDLKLDKVIESVSEGNIEKEFPAIGKLINQKKFHPQQIAPNPNETFAITILPNAACNLSCSYCYASKAHGHASLNKKDIDNVLNFFIDPERISRRDLYISFGGGGEPFLSWPLVKYTMEQADKKAVEHGFKMNYSFASNGTVINQDVIDTLKKHQVKPNISFDILERIQNKERGMYTMVADNLHTLIEAGITPTINSVITPNNVHLQEEMVLEIAHNYKGIKRLSFDSLVDPNYFSSADDLHEFYQTYNKYFFEARETAKEHDIRLSCIKHHNLELIKSRACAGGFDITPDGEISMCFFVSSPNDQLYNDFIYGNINKTNGSINLDTQKYEDLLNTDISYNDKCDNCFIKYHCGGGCLYQVKSYTSEMMNEICEFMRSFSVRVMEEYVSTDILEDLKNSGTSGVIEVFRR